MLPYDNPESSILSSSSGLVVTIKVELFYNWKRSFRCIFDLKQMQRINGETIIQMFRIKIRKTYTLFFGKTYCLYKGLYKRK